MYEIQNLVHIMLWATEWDCGVIDLDVVSVSCDEWATWTLNENQWINVEFDSGIENDVICAIEIRDNEDSSVTWYIKFTVDTQLPSCTVDVAENTPICVTWSKILTMTVQWATKYSWAWYDSLSNIPN